VETNAISYRVADFLKKHPPFHAVDEGDLVALAAHGRVRFYEAEDFVLWQGEPHRAHVFVIQQGTVSLWDEANGRSVLRDIVGGGDMLGLERFTGARSCAYTARASSDVVVYTFPTEDVAGLLDKYPHAMQHVAANAGVTSGYNPAGARQEPHERFLHDVVKQKTLATCSAEQSVREIARQLAAGADAVAVVDGELRARAIVTSHELLEWIASGHGDLDQPISHLMTAPPATVRADATVTDGVLAMAAAGNGALALTADGAAGGRVHAIVTARDVSAVFGDQPVWILRDVGLAKTAGDLRATNQRARAFIRHHLTGTAPVDWLARFAHAADVSIVRRAIALVPDRVPGACWCFSGAAGRAEALTLASPRPVVVVEDGQARDRAMAAYTGVVGALAECGYLASPETSFDAAFHVASVSEWRSRYAAWVREPILHAMYKARPLFDLRAVDGPSSLWQTLHATVAGNVDHGFLHVLANDCLANLPPLTFFQDAVVEDTGEFANVFRLDESVLSPLVDVGRVFGMACGAGLGVSTLDRFAAARTRFAAHESIFRDAADTLRMVLWQQGRVGIDEGTDGSELPPALLSRQDRHLLKGSFRSILRLVQFAADPAWIKAL
jgi:CBS domain-containing protein